MAKQTFTVGQVLTSAQMTALQLNDYNQTVSAKTASYVLVAADAGTRITMSNASATTITVNTGLFAAGDTLTITNIGAGVCTITAGTATVSTAGSLALNQYDSGTLYFTSTGVSIWNGANPGDITAVTAGTGISGGGTSGAVTVTNSMATAITTNGDLIYGTGSGTFNRLGIGSSAQVLTVASGVPSWATPSSGGGLTLINTGGTTLSGTTTTVSSIPASYKQLQIIVRGAKPVTIDTIIALRLNTDTGNNYFAINTPTTASGGQTFNNSYFVMNTNGLSNDADAQYNSAWVTLPDYSTTTNYKTIQSLDFSKYAYAGVTANWSASLKYGAYSSATVISSISIIITGASGATAGTVFVYGVN